MTKVLSLNQPVSYSVTLSSSLIVPHDRAFGTDSFVRQLLCQLMKFLSDRESFSVIVVGVLSHNEERKKGPIPSLGRPSVLKRICASSRQTPRDTKNCQGFSPLPAFYLSPESPADLVGSLLKLIEAGFGLLHSVLAPWYWKMLSRLPQR